MLDFDPRDDMHSHERSSCEPQGADSRDRNVDDARTLSRGLASRKGDDQDHVRESLDVFARGLDLPRGQARERVLDRARTYELNGDGSRALAAVGAFRVISERDLGKSLDGPGRELRSFRQQGLIRTVPLNQHDGAVVLTEGGRRLLEGRQRERDPDRRQSFYARANKPRERTHDAQIYRAFFARPNACASVEERFAGCSSTAN
jgi:hypothetical protein